MNETDDVKDKEMATKASEEGNSIASENKSDASDNKVDTLINNIDDKKSEENSIPEKKEDLNEIDNASNNPEDTKQGEKENKNNRGYDGNFWKRNKKKMIVGLIILFVVAIAIVVLSMIFYGKTSFDYHGMIFEKVLFGQIYVYQTNMTIAKTNPAQFTLTLRNDPRKLDSIPINFSVMHGQGYFSVTPDTLKCGGDALIAAFQVGQFVKILGGSIEATVTENFSSNTLPVKTCNDASNTVTVLELRPFSEQSRIYVDANNSNCIILEAKNCSVAEVSERFVLGLIEKNMRSQSFTDQIAEVVNGS
jgi:hypothetical protein